MDIRSNAGEKRGREKGSMESSVSRVTGGTVQGLNLPFFGLLPSRCFVGLSLYMDLWPRLYIPSEYQGMQCVRVCSDIYGQMVDHRQKGKNSRVFAGIFVKILY